MCGVAWFLAGGGGGGPPRVGGCVCVCREPIVPHDIWYGVQFFYVFIML